MLVLNAPATEPPPVCSRSFLAEAIESLHIGQAHAAPAKAATTIATSSSDQANFQRDIGTPSCGGGFTDRRERIPRYGKPTGLAPCVQAGLLHRRLKACATIMPYIVRATFVGAACPAAG